MFEIFSETKTRSVSTINMEVLEASGITITELHELCSKHRIPIPRYEYFRECVPANTMPFRVVCHVSDNIVEDGHGLNKKSAKQIASFKAFQKLQRHIEENPGRKVGESSPVVPRQQHLPERMLQDLKYNDAACEKQGGDGDDEDLAAAPDLVNQPGASGLPFGPTSDPLAAIQCLKLISGPTWQVLMEMNAVQLKASEHIQILSNVAEEQKATVEYFNFAPQPDDDSYLSIVSVNLNPKLTFMGSGTSVNQAEMSAAFYALQFFRLSNCN